MQLVDGLSSAPLADTSMHRSLRTTTTLSRKVLANAATWTVERLSRAHLTPSMKSSLKTTRNPSGKLLESAATCLHDKQEHQQ